MTIYYPKFVQRTLYQQTFWPSLPSLTGTAITHWTVSVKCFFLWDNITKLFHRIYNFLEYTVFPSPCPATVVSGCPTVQSCFHDNTPPVCAKLAQSNKGLGFGLFYTTAVFLNSCLLRVYNCNNPKRRKDNWNVFVLANVNDFLLFPQSTHQSLASASASRCLCCRVLMNKCIKQYIKQNVLLFSNSFIFGCFFFTYYNQPQKLNKNYRYDVAKHVFLNLTAYTHTLFLPCDS